MLYIKRQPSILRSDTIRALDAAHGYLFLNLKKEAVRELKMIKEDDAKSPEVVIATGRVLVGMEKWSKVLTNSSFALSMFPDLEEVLVQRAFSLRKLGRLDEADWAIEEAPEWLSRTGILYYNLACYEARLGDLKIAKVCINQAVRINPAMKKSARTDSDLGPLFDH